jgi:hypothetical protein
MQVKKLPNNLGKIPTTLKGAFSTLHRNLSKVLQHTQSMIFDATTTTLGLQTNTNRETVNEANV